MKPVNFNIGEVLDQKRPASKHDVITNRIIESLESNQIPWKKPWISIAPQNLFSKKAYRGINHILLSMIPTKYPYFATFNQVREAGGSILKGSKSVPVFFYSNIQKNNEQTEEDHKKDDSYFLMKQYQVFTYEQIDGIDFSFHMDNLTNFKPIERAEKLVNAYLESQNLKVFPAQSAAYLPGQDHLLIPDKSLFLTVDAYYSTVFHEIIHSTGHPNRLKRKGFAVGEYHSKKSENYAFEELVAEFGAAILASYCGVDTTIEEAQSVAYIKSWLDIFKQDPQIAYRAASKAQAAVDFILLKTGLEIFESKEDEV